MAKVLKYLWQTNVPLAVVTGKSKKEDLFQFQFLQVISENLFRHIALIKFNFYKIITSYIGVEDGIALRMPKQGNMPLGNEGVPGDLYVRLHVAPHEIFKRQGLNIHVDTMIPFYTAILGGYIRVPTIDGNVELKVPPGAQPEQQALMKKRGIQQANSNYRGDQIVTFKVTIPK